MATKAKAEVDTRPRQADPSCERCPLQERSATVCCQSVGPRDASLFFVGEALGANEEELGRPFVGDAGFKLNYLLSRAKLKRKEVRIGNCVRCRPPGNKTPTKKHLTACRPYLLHDILTGKPKVIVALGATAINALMPGQRNVDKARGFPEEVTFSWESPKGKVYEHKCWVVPTYHPAACLHDWRNDDLAVRDIQVAKALAKTGKNPLKWPGTKVTVVKTFTEAIKLIRHLKRIGKFVLDLETTGLDPHTAKILCIGFCWKEGQATVLPLLQQGAKAFWKRHEFDAIVEELTELLEEAILYGQNIKFDIKHLRALTGIIEYRIGFDTMNAHHCVDENKPHNLTFLCQWYLRWMKYDALMLPFQGRDDGYASVPNAILWKYCGYDVDGTWQVRRKLIPLLKRDDVIIPFRTEIQLINPLADVEYRGVKVDEKKLAELAVQYRQEIEKAKSYLIRLAAKKMGEKWISAQPKGVFNPNSPKQLAQLLLKCGAKLGRKTASGNISTDKHVMGALELKSGTPGTIARKMKEVRKLTKYIGTYLDGTDGDGGFKQWIRSKSRIHANYNIATARTGRLSADDPPLQTVPRLGGLRGMFLPDDPEHIFLSIDYQKIELCVMAYLANDEVMARELIEQQDLHSRMALTKRLQRDPTDAEFKELLPTVGKEERALAKGVNFGIPYGIGVIAIVEQNPDAFPARMDKQKRKKVVQAIMDAYFEKYWGVAEFREKQVRLAHKNGIIRTDLKRLRRLAGMQWFDSRWALETEHRDLDLSHLEREAMNMPVQSFASDSLSKATTRVHKGIKRWGIPTLRTVMTLHDQLVFNVHKQYQDEATEKLVECMEFVLPKTKKYRYEMPIRVDVGVQRFWGESEYE